MKTSRSTGWLESSRQSRYVERVAELRALPRHDTSDFGASWLPRIDMPDSLVVALRRSPGVAVAAGLRVAGRCRRLDRARGEEQRHNAETSVRAWRPPTCSRGCAGRRSRWRLPRRPAPPAGTARSSAARSRRPRDTGRRESRDCAREVEVRGQLAAPSRSSARAFANRPFLR